MRFIGKYVVILDSDISYATAFANYLNKSSVLECTIQVFTEIELLLKFIHTERIAFALVQDLYYELVQEAIKDEKIPIICLKESKEFTVDRYSLYKYQSMNSITEEIRSIVNCQSSVKEEYDIVTKEQIITIISPSGSIEYNVLALAIANYISKQSRTIYINLNPFSCLEYFLWKDSTKGLSDILYYYRQGIEQVLDVHLPYRRIDNLFYIPQVEHYSDLFYLAEGDIEKLIQEARESYECRVAVVCIKELNESTETIINKSSQVMIECGELEEQRKQHDRLVTMLKQKGLLQDKEVIMLPNINLGQVRQKDYNQIVFHNAELDNIVASIINQNDKVEITSYG